MLPYDGALHVDICRIDPLYMTTPVLVRRVAPDDRLLVKPDGTPTQLKQGWATYLSASTPHTADACPFRET